MRKSTSVIIIIIALAIAAGGVFIFSSQKKNNENINNEIKPPNIKGRLQIAAEKIREFRLNRLSESPGLRGLNETDQYIEEINANQTQTAIADDQISNYQTYVTPNDSTVKTIVSAKSYEQIYQIAVSWLWVEDKILNGTDEKWLSPNFFLTQTPSMPTNPAQGRIASDCESQAYTLVSALRAAGIKPENVRVVTGKVNFGGTIGGHAWVEVFDESKVMWFQLEATSGDYYDSATKTLNQSAGLPYDYFKTYEYPSIQIWTYFNDKYFWDNARQEGVAPENWLKYNEPEKIPASSEVKYKLPQKLQDFRSQRAERLQNFIPGFDRSNLRNLLKESIKQK